MTETIIITVAVAKVQTMADGSKRYVFDGSEMNSYEAAQLMECQRLGVVGKLTFEAIEQEAEEAEDEPKQQRSTRKIHI